MGKIVSFMDSKLIEGDWQPKYGSTDFNRIIKNLASAGVVNESETSCKVIADTATTVKISPGITVMADGSTIEISGDYETVTLESTTLKNYVYFFRDQANNTIAIKATTAAPTGDYVMLAEVTGTTIVDARQYSSFKIMRGLGNGYFVKKNISISGTITKSWTKIHEEDVGTHLFKYATIKNVGTVYWFGFFDFEESKLYGFRTNLSGSNVVFSNWEYGIYITTGTSWDQQIKLVYNGTKVEFWMKCSNNSLNVSSDIDLLVG